MMVLRSESQGTDEDIILVEVFSLVGYYRVVTARWGAQDRLCLCSFTSR
jgi:hypothetical protein